MDYLKTLATLAALTIGTSAFAQDKVMVGEPSWPGAKIMSRVIAQVIETRLGGETGYAPGANAVIFAAMDGARGDIDVHPDVWLPNQASFTDEYVTQKGTVALSEGSYEGRAGFCVPTYVAEEHGIKSIYDLAPPPRRPCLTAMAMAKAKFGSAGLVGPRPTCIKLRCATTGLRPFLSRQQRMRPFSMRA
ncbi:glycine betaine ABC transporter substrate-binding protein [Albirhodobacter sp. R86504]|uniref:glycine betaine ABC transporter substrate-binding protein n=1 Tax=Albirhodobacter sp. R86504 TaxID=3093848 RepID=UPI0036734056